MDFHYSNVVKMPLAPIFSRSRGKTLARWCNVNQILDQSIELAPTVTYIGARSTLVASERASLGVRALFLFEHSMSLMKAHGTFFRHENEI